MQLICNKLTACFRHDNHLKFPFVAYFLNLSESVFFRRDILILLVFLTPHFIDYKSIVHAKYQKQ